MTVELFIEILEWFFVQNWFRNALSVFKLATRFYYAFHFLSCGTCSKVNAQSWYCQGCEIRGPTPQKTPSLLPQYNQLPNSHMKILGSQLQIKMVFQLTEWRNLNLLMEFIEGERWKEEDNVNIKYQHNFSHSYIHEDDQGTLKGRINTNSSKYGLL